MLAQLAASSCGITLLPDNVVQQYVERGELVRVLSDWKTAHGIFHLVYPSVVACYRLCGYLLIILLSTCILYKRNISGKNSSFLGKNELIKRFTTA